MCRWFHFRLTGVQNHALVVKLVNAGQSSFPEAWPGYKACASYDLTEWFRVQTAWDEKAGVITMQHKSNHVRTSSTALQTCNSSEVLPRESNTLAFVSSPPTSNYTPECSSFKQLLCMQRSSACSQNRKPVFLLQDSIYFAYFPPYSYARHQELVAQTHAKKNVRLDVIGETLDGHDLDVLRIGEHSRHTYVYCMHVCCDSVPLGATTVHSLPYGYCMWWTYRLVSKR